MDTGWYIKFDDGHEEGPLSPAMLKSRAQQGEVVPSTLVRHGADGNWVAASHVKGLFGSKPNEAPVIQQQPQVEPPPVAPPIKDVSQTNLAELLDEAAEEEAVRKQQQDRMAELLTEAEQESARKQQQQVSSDSERASRLVPCVDCEKPISRLASVCPNCGCPVIVPSRPDKYPALQFIAGVNKVFAVVVPILCLIGLLLIISNDKAGVVNPQTIIPLVVYMIVAPLALWGTAELILLLIGIENNTSTLRGVTREERRAKEDHRKLLEERTRESEERKQARHEGARQKLPPDLHAVLGTTGNKVAVQVELVAPITIGSFASPLPDLGFELHDNRPWTERFMGQKTKRITGYIDAERLADLALSPDVVNVRSWQPSQETS